jgi:hypothetical protein
MGVSAPAHGRARPRGARLDPRLADPILDTSFVEGMEPGRRRTKRDIRFVPLREQRLACRPIRDPSNCETGPCQRATQTRQFLDLPACAERDAFQREAIAYRASQYRDAPRNPIIGCSSSRRRRQTMPPADPRR